ncbi:MAG: bacterioferritin-associated ferredoxin [Pseudomonadales bacterium]|nr:bacterioferritin-associated ferredoxin [Pseudomonadales bacterium]
MYICLCKGITDTQIRETVLNGSATSLGDVQNQLGVGSQCGGCVESADQVIQLALAQLNKPHVMEPMAAKLFYPLLST